MIIPCFRCKAMLESPNLSNADYVIANDMIETVIEEGLPKDIQKTGIICPDCYRDTDFVIWGIHKKAQ